MGDGGGGKGEQSLVRLSLWDGVVSLRWLADGALLVMCKDEGQREKLMRLRELGGRKVVEARKVGGESVVKGVVSGVPVEVDLGEWVMEAPGLVGVKRLQARREGERVDSLSVMVEFERRVLPERLYIGQFSYRVRPYVLPPLRCYRCQGYGHIAAGCRRELRCGRCGGGHGFGQCEEGVEVRCANCHSHSHSHIYLLHAINYSR